MQPTTPSVPKTEDTTGVAFIRPHATVEEAARLPAKLQLRYAAWLRLSGQFEQASELMEIVVRSSGESAGLLDERAAHALARRDMSAAREAWETRLTSFPAPSARASFARALLELGEMDEASHLAEELLADHGDLTTVQSLSAEIALQGGDLATAHDFWSAQLEKEGLAVTPTLAIARIALLSGDPEEARAALDRVMVDPAALTPAQLAAAAGLADLLGQPMRSQMLRLRFAELEVARTMALAAQIDEALGRTPETVSSAAPQPPLSDRSVPPDRVETVRAVEPVLVEMETDLDDATPTDPRVMETLRDVFGHEELLPGQAAVINQVLGGKDTLAILPTGAGKSLTFQLSAMLLPGTTLVLSPLIALMKDQLDGLPPALRRQSLLVNSTLSPDEQRSALDDIASGRMKLVYAAPERLRQPAFLRALQQGEVSLVVVDEAHCISLWGHDFRPDYLSIPASLPELSNPPLLAMTATASPETASSLSAAFHRELDVVRTSSFRSNLFYAAERFNSKEEKARRVVALCRELPGQGIVYVSSRRDAENLAGVLGDNGVKAVPYHAGIDRERRSENQDRFMSGTARVVVATVAFGMGIDKSDVRFIIHFSPSTSLEAYAQESGRAGRDGDDSRCVLLFTSSDRAIQTRLANRDALNLDTLRQVFSGIKRHAVGSWAIFEPSRIVLSMGSDDDPDDRPDPRIGIGLLEQGGLLERHPNAPVSWSLTRLASSTDDAYGFVSADDDALWSTFAAWADLNDTPGQRATIQTAAACSTLGVSPETLARILDEHPAWEAREGDRMTCLKLFPVEANAGARLQRVLDEAAHRARDRVDRTMTYAEGRRCRHAELAAHLGERLTPCGIACDVCTGESAAASGARARRQAGPRKRSVATAADAETALKALATAPFPVAKTGLTRLLEGSIQSRIQADRSSFFGALADLQKSKIEAVIDALVEENVLIYDRSREFPVLRVTEEGAARVRRAFEAN